MARHLATTDKLGAAVYFCDSRSPWQKGSNEYANGLLRDYFPNGVSIAEHLPEHLVAVENELNDRPRMLLQDRCPAGLFTALLAPSSPFSVATLTNSTGPPGSNFTCRRHREAGRRSAIWPKHVLRRSRPSLCRRWGEFKSTSQH